MRRWGRGRMWLSMLGVMRCRLGNWPRNAIRLRIRNIAIWKSWPKLRKWERLFIINLRRWRGGTRSVISRQLKNINWKKLEINNSVYKSKSGKGDMLRLIKPSLKNSKQQEEPSISIETPLSMPVASNLWQNYRFKERSC